MKFCKNCGNMYYLSISEENPNILSYYCRNCGDTELNETENICVHSTNKGQSDDEIISNIVNRYTKLDPTLPRINKIPCPNEACPTNVEGIPVEIILIRYDNSNMKYIYLCSTCETTWKTDEKRDA